jgi:HEAT repeat protein
LVDGLSSIDNFTRLRAVGALQRIGDMSAIPALERARQDRDESVARAAEQAIAKITAQAGVPGD